MLSRFGIQRPVEEGIAEVGGSLAGPLRHGLEVQVRLHGVNAHHPIDFLLAQEHAGIVGQDQPGVRAALLLAETDQTPDGVSPQFPSRRRWYVTFSRAPVWARSTWRTATEGWPTHWP